jgi:UDP-N-acetylmuramyl pentapeptide phosphotransferase/UDP-N-acetylglucosamine-1-phosphate transferase
MDIPDGKIKCHQAPTPYLGGVAIYLSFIGFSSFVYLSSELLIMIPILLFALHKHELNK